MPQFPIPPGKKIGETVSLSPTDSRHVAVVLRMKPGESVRLFDGTVQFESKIIHLSPDKVHVEILSKKISLPIQGEITLCQALLKKDRMEWVVQKATELGTCRLVPFLSERTIPSGEKSAKITRWQKIADEALKQCGRSTTMEVLKVSTFAFLSEKPNGNSKILFHPSGEPLSKIKLGDKIELFIGPEGGYSGKEITLAKERGFSICSLGSLILRSETAAISALTLVQHELGNL